MRILILEDSHQRIQQVLTLSLDHQGNRQVFVARTVDEAKRTYRREDPIDLLLLDHDLGGDEWVDSERSDCGMGFVRWLLGNEEWASIDSAVVVHSHNPIGARRMVAALSGRAMWFPFGKALLAALDRPLEEWYVPQTYKAGEDLRTIKPSTAAESAAVFVEKLLPVYEERETLRTTNVEFQQSNVNTPDEELVANLESSIRRGHMQVRPDAPKTDRVVIVGGGPSLQDPEVERELVDLVMQGAKVCALNNAYAWCLERNLRVGAHVILDARESNARFVGPHVDGCMYLYASQCHPAVWDAVEGRPRVFIWHACYPDSAEAPVLDDFYGEKRWMVVSGGTTVATRALILLRKLGFYRFDLFGVDSCWLDGQHHAWDQEENRHDKRFKVSVTPRDSVEPRMFECAPWHLKQFEDFLQVIKVNGEHFLLNVHGQGLIRAALEQGAQVQVHTDGHRAALNDAEDPQKEQDDGRRCVDAV